MEGGWSDGLIGPGQPVLDPVPSREPVEMLLVEPGEKLIPKKNVRIRFGR
jgi:hypothetical protein